MRRLRIGIDTLPFLDNIAGAEVLCSNIIKTLVRLDPDLEYVLYLSSINQDFFRVDQDKVQNRVFDVDTSSRWRRVLFQQMVLPVHLRRDKIDLLFSPCNIAPIFHQGPTVLLVFDLHWLVLPHLVPPLKLRYLRSFLKASARRASHLLTLSDHSARDIQRLLNVPAEKLTVISAAVDPRITPLEDHARLHQVRQRYHLPDRFVLFVSQLLRRKNLPALLRAFALRVREEGFRHDLVVVGGEGDGSEEAITTLRELQLEGRVHLLGCVPMEDLCAIYNLADLLVYPSLYEGFGLPVLEAMACRVPVIASDRASLPEVAGDAALLVDPTDVAGLAKAIDGVLTDPARQATLQEKGFARAAQFSWEHVTARVLRAFKESLST